MNADMSKYLQATPTIDFDNESIIEFAQKSAGNSADQRKRAIHLYYAVRDKIRYDPYSLDLSIEGLRASTTLKNKRGWCVAKAILLAACCRYFKIPARLGFADVKNHLSTARMRELMKTDIFYWHGYTTIFLDDKWIKATPAFNIELCDKFRLKPLEFDGYNDSIYHSLDLDGNKHMEYIRDRGERPDVPIDQIMETFKREYLPDDSWIEASDFDREVEQEISAK